MASVSHPSPTRWVVHLASQSDADSEVIVELRMSKAEAANLAHAEAMRIAALNPDRTDLPSENIGSAVLGILTSVAAINRGNHASGTPSERPSSSSTHIVSRSKASFLALTEVLIPDPLDLLPAFAHHPCQLRKPPARIARAAGDPHLRIQPEFRLAVTAFRMDVHGLPGRSLVREEVKAHVAVAEDDRHSDPGHAHCDSSIRA